jgi:phosphomannomutase/phosphoglucomutase
VSTSNCVEDMVKPLGGRVLYTRVGSPTVAHAMRKEGAVFGGEENGGLIFPEHQLVRDGLMSIARMLEVLALSGKAMSSLLAEVPRYANVKAKVHVAEDAKGPILERFAATQKGKVDTTDGVKAWSDDGWVLVRASGTEPLVRIFAESKREEGARRLVEQATRQIEGLATQLGGKH